MTPVSLPGFLNDGELSLSKDLLVKKWNGEVGFVVVVE